jgi:hypothetical protein
MSEKYGRLQRQKARLEIQAEVFGTILRGLDGPQSEAVELVNTKGPHAFNSEATLLLKAATRAQAVAFLGMFPPVGLDIIELRDGGRSFVVFKTQLQGQVVRKRDSIAPFLYSVVQIRKVARHTLTWVHKLSNDIQVTIECDIAEDRAAFTFEHLDDQGHNQVLFRRVPNNFVPDGPRHGLRGTDWSVVKDVAASVTVWWPWTHPKVVSSGWMAHETIGQLAEILLEVRLEAHG